MVHKNFRVLDMSVTYYSHRHILVKMTATGLENDILSLFVWDFLFLHGKLACGEVMSYIDSWSVLALAVSLDSHVIKESRFLKTQNCFDAIYYNHQSFWLSFMIAVQWWSRTHSFKQGCMHKVRLASLALLCGVKNP